jgi:Fic/DOC family
MSRKAFDQIIQDFNEALAFARLAKFVRESNAIEGILRDPTAPEITAHKRFLALPQLDLTAVTEFQSVIAPGKPVRSAKGMNVRVGTYIAPTGGPDILRQLESILREASISSDPWSIHVAFEKLHPFMDGNGRTGRAIWAWQMRKMGRDPFALPFLHRIYYQMLEAC